MSSRPAQVCFDGRSFFAAATLALALLLGSVSRADSAFEAYRFGALLGYSSLSGDPGQGHPDAFAYGMTLGTLLTPSWAVDLDLISTNHSDTDHLEVSLGADYYPLANESVMFDPRVSFGLSRISNYLKPYNVTGTSFGAFLGVGFDVRYWENWLPGLEIRYNKVAEAEANLITGTRLKTVQDNFNIMLRVMFEFGEFGWD